MNFRAKSSVFKIRVDDFHRFPIKIDGFPIKIDGFPIKIDGFHIKIDEFHIKNTDFHSKKPPKPINYGSPLIKTIGSSLNDTMCTLVAPSATAAWMTVLSCEKKHHFMVNDDFHIETSFLWHFERFYAFLGVILK
jgi:hypothetical protein